MRRQGVSDGAPCASSGAANPVEFAAHQADKAILQRGAGGTTFRPVFSGMPQ
jgi:hypothetical protein